MGAVASLVEKINMAATLRLIFFFNVLDAFLTITWVEHGLAEEANPIMAYAMNHGMLFFALVKIMSVLLAVVILWTLRKHKVSLVAAFASACFMFLVLVYHAVGLYLAMY